MERLDFIGVTEHYADDLCYFSREFIGAPLKAEVHNVAKTRKRRRFQPSPFLVGKIEEYHAKDMELYQMALDQRAKRA